MSIRIGGSLRGRVSALISTGVLLLSPLATLLRAQAEVPPLRAGEGTVEGALLDEETAEPLGFANVAAYRLPGDSLVAGGTTDFDGAFALGGLPYGNYRVELSFIGYTSADREITLSAAEPVASLGQVAIAVGGQELTEAVVTAERAVMELGLDRKVFNVEKNIAAAGGSGEDLLRNIPSITVDLDGNVSLRGSGNVRFLINGRPSGLVGSDPATFLKSLTAANIERVEVITNPGAQFDPEGTAGLINIVLKRVQEDGFNTSVTLNLGTGNKIDGNVEANWRKGRFNSFAGVSGRYDERVFRGFRDQRTSLADTAFSGYFKFDGLRQNESLTAKIGTEYAVSERGTIQVQGTRQWSSGTSTNARRVDFRDAEGVLARTSNRDEREPEVEREYEVRADFRTDFKGKEGRTLSAALQTSYSGELETENYFEEVVNRDGELLYTNRQNAPVDEERREYLAQADFSEPFNESWQLDVGWRSTRERLRTDAAFNDFDVVADAFERVDSASTLFDYDEDVHALYSTLGGEAGKFSFSGGFRAELALTEGRLVEPEARAFTNDYFQVYPSVFVGYDLKEGRTLQASYSRRVNRPRSRELNPFVDRGDRYNLRSGNPALRPEFINSYELNLQQRYGRGTLTAGTYFRETIDQIARLTERVSDTVQLNTRGNVALGRDYGVELILTFRALEKLEFTASGNAYYTQIRGDASDRSRTVVVDADGYLFDGRLQASYEFPWGVESQATYFYRSPGVTPQGTIETIQSLDLGFRKSILNDRGAITLRVSDLFNTRRYRFTNQVAGVTTRSQFQRESRIAYVGFQYRFGANAERDRERDERGGGRDDGGGEDF